MTAGELRTPADGDWIAISGAPLPVDDARTWVTIPECGGVVLFCGAVRDHSDGRAGVTSLEYEAYEEHVVRCLTDVAGAARRQWHDIGRVAILHRVGLLHVGDVAVVVAVSTPHRAEAFAAAEFCIDTLKHTVPIWKRETWEGGSDWSVCSQESRLVASPSPAGSGT